MSQRTSLQRSMLLAAMVSLGIITVWCTVFAWLATLAERSTYTSGAYEQLYVRLDGEPVIVRQINGGMSQEVVSLEREPTAGDIYQILHPSYVPPHSDKSTVSGSDWTNRLSSVSDGGSPATFWYLVHDGRTNGRAYGVGYHSITKRVAGYFARQGFSEGLPPREDWFHVTGDSGLVYAMPDRMYLEPYLQSQPAMYVLANQKLWKIDTRKRSVTPLLECADAEAVGWAWRLQDPVGGHQQTAAASQRSLFIRTPETCLVLDPESGQTSRYPLPESLRTAALGAIQLADDRLLLTSYQQTAGTGQVLVWIDRQGKEVARKQVTLVFPNGVGGERATIAVVGLAGPAPLAQALLISILAWSRLATGQADSVLTASGQAIGLAWPTLALIVAISLIGAIAAYQRQRRFSLPGAAGWATFVFFFGVPGWVAYRFHRSWPALEDCPGCHQPAPRDRTKCTECGALFPPPELHGTEVFA